LKTKKKENLAFDSGAKIGSLRVGDGAWEATDNQMKGGIFCADFYCKHDYCACGEENEWHLL
jgi:hypothetical protein